MGAIEHVSQWPVERAKAIWENIWSEGLWKRMLKIVIATTIVNSIVLIPASKAAIGAAAYLGGITTAFGHPGRRFGQMAEALILTVVGTVLGVGWSILGLYLGSLLIHSNPPAGYTIRAIFLALAFLIHGFLRSHTPRIFLGTVLFIIVAVVTLVSPAKDVTSASATQILYPILLAVGVLFLVNISIFPEFSSGFLGKTTVETLQELSETLKQAGSYLVQETARQSEPGAGTDKEDEPILIEDVTASKAKIRAKLSGCKSTQSECNFELAFSILPPRDLKAISDVKMTKLTMNVIAIIGACESKFALAGDEGLQGPTPRVATTLKDIALNEDVLSEHNPTSEVDISTENRRKSLAVDADDLALVKPRREIEFGDPVLLRHLLEQITRPYLKIQGIVDRSVDVITACVAYTYRVPKLPSGAPAPKGVEIEELDICIDTLKQGIGQFDNDIQLSLEATGVWDEIRKEFPDIMPREEIFLVSSFYLNMRQASIHVCEMLEHSRYLVDECHKRRGRRRFYAPRISWRKWLYTGGGEDQLSTDSSSPYNFRRDVSDERGDEANTTNLLEPSQSAAHSMKDPELGREHVPNSKPPPKQKTADEGCKLVSSEPPRIGITACLREQLAETVEWLQHSNDVEYAFKVCVASFLTLWPAFVASWNEWYSLNRGLWAALQLVLITEPTLGSSWNTFVLRGFGTTFGCLWGWAAFEAGNGNRIVCAAMICIGTIPASYVIVGSRFVKAGIVTIVSITVVAMATELETVPGSATENFLKRFIAFMIGAAVALIFGVVLLPVKARTRMVEALASTLGQIIELENCIAFGIESPLSINILPPSTIQRFDRASVKAKAALTAAEGLLPFCSKEFRLKGSFEGLLPIYKEIAFVLRQIIDRMDNMIVLRTEYGSGPLQEYNSQIFQYRRNLAASIVITLFAVQEALATRLPLPQFLPSCRLAQLRMINRVRDVVRDDVRRKSESSLVARKQAVRQNFLSWNAGSMAQAEIVEYLEELCDLTKLLVGANEFRSGLLTRPTYRDYVQKIGAQEPKAKPSSDEARNREESKKLGLNKRRTTTHRGSLGSEDTELPYSLQRIQSKRLDATIKRQQTWEQQNKSDRRD